MPRCWLYCLFGQTDREQLVGRATSRPAVKSENYRTNSLTESYIPSTEVNGLTIDFSNREELVSPVADAANHPVCKPAVKGDFGIDENVIRALGSKFRSKVEHRLPALKKAVENSDETELLSAGHWIKGSAGMVQLNNLADCGVKLESLAKSRSFSEIDQLLEDIEQLVSG